LAKSAQLFFLIQKGKEQVSKMGTPQKKTKTKTKKTKKSVHVVGRVPICFSVTTAGYD
jgi:hypothetical protein